MKVDIYDSRDNCIDTIENVECVTGCKDGRHLITYSKKCESCGHIENYTYQVPQGYEVGIRN